ncbi:hypothetical protein [Methanohalophilus sp. RSK]|uniref:hypothetical protein n=1 Tax=Methanohalophilus sp. RSK TaxID=2485783 RepID=UPI0011CE341C|nr:hypothetical protein [Methanohalophilus sp. RSK]
MENKTIVVLAGTLLIGIMLIGTVSAQWVSSGYGMTDSRYSDDGDGAGYYCNYGYYSAEDATSVITEDEAISLFEETTGIDVNDENVYQMGRWFVINYVDEDAIKQGRVDSITEDVIEDFSAYAPQESDEYQNNYRYQRGAGGCMGYR